MDTQAQGTDRSPEVGVELESKFLLNNVSWYALTDVAQEGLEQTYLDFTADGAMDALKAALASQYSAEQIDGMDVKEARVRSVSNQGGIIHKVTLKGDGDAERAEAEAEVVREVASDLLGKFAKGKPVKKTRYKFPLLDEFKSPTGLTLEVDVFNGVLRGLVTAEVEQEVGGSTVLDNETLARYIRATLGEDVSIQDVTTNPHFKNKNLAQLSSVSETARLIDGTRGCVACLLATDGGSESDFDINPENPTSLAGPVVEFLQEALSYDDMRLVSIGDVTIQSINGSGGARSIKFRVDNATIQGCFQETGEEMMAANRIVMRTAEGATFLAKQRLPRKERLERHGCMVTGTLRLQKTGSGWSRGRGSEYERVLWVDGSDLAA